METRKRRRSSTPADLTPPKVARPRRGRSHSRPTMFGVPLRLWLPSDSMAAAAAPSASWEASPSRARRAVSPAQAPDAGAAPLEPVEAALTHRPVLEATAPEVADAPRNHRRTSRPADPSPALAGQVSGAASGGPFASTATAAPAAASDERSEQAASPAAAPCLGGTAAARKSSGAESAYASPEALADFLGGGTCVICLESLFGIGRAVAIAGCGHIFHRACLDEARTWSCPQCRQPLDVPKEPASCKTAAAPLPRRPSESGSVIPPRMPTPCCPPNPDDLERLIRCLQWSARSRQLGFEEITMEQLLVRVNDAHARDSPVGTNGGPAFRMEDLTGVLAKLSSQGRVVVEGALVQIFR